MSAERRLAETQLWSGWLRKSWQAARVRQRAEQADRCARGIHETLEVPSPGTTVACVNCKTALTI